MPPDNRKISIFRGQPAVQIAFEDYLAQGHDRTIIGLWRKYNDAVKKDPYAVVPSLDFNELSDWEARYNWRTLAYQWDAEERVSYMRERGNVLENVHSKEIEYSGKLLKKADEALDKLPIDALSAMEILKYMTEGIRINREASVAKLNLTNPSNTEQTGVTDFLDSVRNLIISQTNNTVYTTQPLPPSHPVLPALPEAQIIDSEEVLDLGD